ncbi:MAG: 50S ribosomal protein L25 [Planctomycetes bacterium]|nr:50S ribosomal protein L25 [Planctomycetota bacterium]
MKKGVINAESRKKGTKGDLGKLRRAGRVPGILYGGGGEPVTVSVLEKDVRSALRTGVRVLELRVGAEPVGALLKDVSWDHLGEKLVSVDFQRLVKGAAIEIRVPLRFQGTPAGLKEGGVFNVIHDTLLVSCQPEAAPDHIDVEVSGLAMGDSLHVREVALPEGVSAAEDAAAVLAVVTYSDKEIEAAATVPEEAAVAPEVIGEAERKAAAPGAKKEKEKKE